jgi:hypothetical protein
MRTIAWVILLLAAGSIRAHAQQPATMTDLNNTSLVIDSLAGKKVLLLLLPLRQDTALTSQLLEFQARWRDSIRVIGLVCLADCQLSADSVRSWYNPLLGAGVFVTEGADSSRDGNPRESVIRWLSGRNRTERALDPGLSGSKFFLDKQGRLYAQPGASTSLRSSVIDNIVRTNVPEEQ